MRQNVTYQLHLVFVYSSIGRQNETNKKLKAVMGFKKYILGLHAVIAVGVLGFGIDLSMHSKTIWHSLLVLFLYALPIIFVAVRWHAHRPWLKVISAILLPVTSLFFLFVILVVESIGRIVTSLLVPESVHAFFSNFDPWLVGFYACALATLVEFCRWLWMRWKKRKIA